MKKTLNSLLFIFYLVAGASASGARPATVANAFIDFSPDKSTSHFTIGAAASS